MCETMRRIAKVVKEGLEVALDFQGKTYILAFAGDSRGINRAELR